MKSVFAVGLVCLVMVSAGCGGGGGSDSGSVPGPTPTTLSFSAPLILNGDNPYSFALNDLDNDGYLDIIVPSATGTSSMLQVYYGDSESSFQRSAVANIGTWSSYIAAAKNNSGDLKIFVSDADNLGCSTKVFDLASDGTANLSSPLFSDSCAVDYLLPGDVNRDGIIDIVSDTGAINLGQSDGSFALAYKPSGMIGGSTAIGDWNRDGISDIASFDNAGTVYIYLGNGDGTFKDPVSVLAPNDGSSSSNGEIKVADLNSDSISDLVAHNGAHIFVFFGNGDGTFQDGVSAIDNSGNIVISFAVGDFNLDGLVDLAVSEPNRTQAVQIYSGNNSGVFKSPQSVNVGYAMVGAIQAMDLDKDGRTDLITANQWENSISVVHNTTPLP